MEKRVYIEDYVSKAKVRKMLENYNAIKQGDYSWKEPTNSGPKVYDGITAGQLDRIMIDQAIEKLPRMEKACCRGRWILELKRHEILKALKITPRAYYDYCNSAIAFIYREINGEKIGVLELMDAIFKD